MPRARHKAISREVLERSLKAPSILVTKRERLVVLESELLGSRQIQDNTNVEVDRRRCKHSIVVFYQL